MGGWIWFVVAAVFLLIELTAARRVHAVARARRDPDRHHLARDGAVVAGAAHCVCGAVDRLHPGLALFRAQGRGPVDRPFLNRRAEGYVGRVFTLEKPIVDGVGTIRIEDTVWRVSGPSLPAGSRVKVSRADGADLAVEAA